MPKISSKKSSKKQSSLPRLIGVVHLPPLPGSPGAHRMHPSEALQKAGLWAVKEAKLLAQMGFDGVILENFGDIPFYKTQVGPETIASLAVISAAIRESTSIQLGINLLRNDPFSALAVAAVTGADFIRTNVLSGVVATDQGLIEGRAAELVRERLRLNAQNVKILADVHVKHAKTLSSSSLTLAIEETAGRGGADGIIITGSTTGRAPEFNDLEEAAAACRHSGVPVFIGSGMTADRLQLLSKEKSAREYHLIVGSALRRGGRAGEPMEPKRLKELVKAYRSMMKSSLKKNVKARRATS